MDDAFARVLEEPGSIAAREALLAAWKQSGDGRAALLEQQLAYEEARRMGRHTEQQRALNLVIARQGRALAGEIARLVKTFTFHRGLVAEISISGRDFVALASKLFTLAPIQHVIIEAPVPDDIDALFSVPELAKVGSLQASGFGDAFGDRGALALAHSPLAAQLRWLSLRDDNIGLAGVEALAASPLLAGVQFLDLQGNAVDPTPVVRELVEGCLYGGRPGLAADLEAKFGPRPWLAIPRNVENWPPMRDPLVITP